MIHEIFITVYKSWENFEGKCSETTYVVAVAKMFLKGERTKRLRQKRKAQLLTTPYQQSNRQTESFEKIAEEGSGEDQLTQYTGFKSQREQAIDNETIIVKRQAKTILEELIGELEKEDEKLPRVLNLYLSGLTDEEIGRVLNTPGKTVFHWRNRAFELLKKSLNKRGIASLGDIL